MSVLTIARCKVATKDHEEFRTKFSAYRDAVLEHEPGTLIYELYMSYEEPDLFLIEECFVDEDARNAHLAADYHQSAVSGLHQYIIVGSASHYRSINE